MQTIVETPPFFSDAEAAGMSEIERMRFVDWISAHPAAGDLIKGAGGARKVRFARPGAGKSGGYRIITFYAEQSTPVFLLALFSKGERGNLTKAECNALATMTKRLLAAYRRPRITTNGARP